MGSLILIQYSLHLKKQKLELGLHRTQQTDKVRHFDENAAKIVNNFNVILFLQFSYYFLK